MQGNNDSGDSSKGHDLAVDQFCLNFGVLLRKIVIVAVLILPVIICALPLRWIMYGSGPFQYHLSGVVVDDLTGSPIEGVVVSTYAFPWKPRTSTSVTEDDGQVDSTADYFLDKMTFHYGSLPAIGRFPPAPIRSLFEKMAVGTRPIYWRLNGVGYQRIEKATSLLPRRSNSTPDFRAEIGIVRLKRIHDRLTSAAEILEPERQGAFSEITKMSHPYTYRIGVSGSTESRLERILELDERMTLFFLAAIPICIVILARRIPLFGQWFALWLCRLLGGICTTFLALFVLPLKTTPTSFHLVGSFYLLTVSVLCFWACLRLGSPYENWLRKPFSSTRLTAYYYIVGSVLGGTFLNPAFEPLWDVIYFFL